MRIRYCPKLGYLTIQFQFILCLVQNLEEWESSYGLSKSNMLTVIFLQHLGQQEIR
jgi:hypothetical protein